MSKNIGKKLHKFKFTYKDIATITGLKLETIRTYAYKGIFNPNDLKSVAEFLIRY